MGNMKVLRGGGGSSKKPERLDLVKVALEFSWNAPKKIFTIRQLAKKLPQLNFKLIELVSMAVVFELFKEDKYRETGTIIKEHLYPDDKDESAYYKKLEILIKADPLIFALHFGKIKLCAADLFDSVNTVLPAFIRNNIGAVYPHLSSKEISHKSPEAKKFLGANWKTVLRRWLLDI